MKNPLLDYLFLLQLDQDRNRTTYARITSLTTEDYPIELIEGIVTAGSISLDGGSAVRRVCNLTMTTEKLNINNIYWSLATKVKIEIGIENHIKVKKKDPNTADTFVIVDYKDIYPEVIWFPQGVYILTDFKTQAQVNNYTITVTGKDKMCLLNGDIGGVFNAETQLDIERVQQEDGTWVDQKRSIAYIIREIVHYYGQESFHNIVIKDIDKLSLLVLYNNATTLYYVENIKTGQITDIMCNDGNVYLMPNIKYYYQELPALQVDFKNLLSDFVFYSPVDEDNDTLIVSDPTIIIDKSNNKYRVRRIRKGQDLGYKIIETYYPDELIAGVGETVTSILDKIIKTFGAFEYFYNLDGLFVFQAKQTYVNTAWNNMITSYDENDESWIQPLAVASLTKYSFEGSKIVSAYQNSPDLGKIKNDFTVWGKKKNSSGVEIPIHMRYAIDAKPQTYATYPKEAVLTNIEGKTIMNESYLDVYITKEYYRNISHLIKENTNISVMKKINKKEPPKYLVDAMSDMVEDPNACWWTIADWAEYYKKLTGVYPAGSLSRFLNIPFIDKVITFPDGTKKNLKNVNILDVNSTTNNIFYTTETLTLNNKKCIGWNGAVDYTTTTKYDIYVFLDLHTKYNVDSWIYKPTMPQEADIIYNLPTKDGFRFKVVDWREIIYLMAKDYLLHNHDDDYEVMIHKNNFIPAYSINLFLNGRTGYEQYYHDIEGFWRLLYAPQDYVDNYNSDNAKVPIYTVNKDDFYELVTDLNGITSYGNFIGPWNKNVVENPSSLVFWFDFFEAESLGLGQFSIPAIGNRPKNSTNDSIRALIYEDIPDVVLVEEEDYNNYLKKGQLLPDYHYYPLNNVLRKYIEDNKIRISTRSVTAQELIDDLLYNYAYCNETIQITAIPIYYLEPNTIISARDEARMVHGYYIINKITLPLDYKGTMLITAIKVPERIY